MTRQEFEPTEGLLEDVMRKQAGSIEKAVLEAVMNSVDANADLINIVIEEDVIVIEDDGDGMTGDEVDEYFRKFGLKADDIEQKDFGKFRIGRGQIFNFGVNYWHSLNNLMVVNLDHDETEIQWDLVEDPDTEEVKRVAVQGDTLVLDTAGLSYNLLEASSHYEGCRITVEPFSNVEYKVDEIISGVRDLIRYIPWVHDVEIQLNGEEVEYDPEPDFETDLAWYSFSPDSIGSSTSIYNQGAFVKSERFVKTESSIITKVDLEVNFARNDVLDTDENYNQIVTECKRFAVETLVEEDNLSKYQRRWLVELASEDPEVLQKVKDLPLIDKSDGEKIPISALVGERISFTYRGNKQAEFLEENSGIIPVSNEFEEALGQLTEPAEVVDYSEAVETETRWEMEEYDYADLSKRRRDNFDRAEWFLREVGFSGKIRPGYSMHFDAWKTDQDELFIEKSYLNESKTEFILEHLIHILEIAAQPGDTRDGLVHNYSFTSSFWNYMEEAPEAQIKLLEGEAP